MGIFPVHQRLLCVAIVAEIFTHACRAQDLAPRAYFITPLHSNAITLTWSLFDGSLDYNDVIPTENATGTYSLSSFSYYHSFGLFHRSAPTERCMASMPHPRRTPEGAAIGTVCPLPCDEWSFSTARFTSFLRSTRHRIPDIARWDLISTEFGSYASKLARRKPWDAEPLQSETRALNKADLDWADYYCTLRMQVALNRDRQKYWEAVLQEVHKAQAQSS
jgi:hypothetical protein